MANLATISHDFSSGAAVLNNTTALDSLMVRMDEQDLAGIKAAADAVLVAATFEGGKKEFYALLVEMCQRHGRGKSQAYLYAAAGWQGFQRIKRLGGAHLWQDADTYAEAHKAVTTYVVREWSVNSAQDLVDYLRELAGIESGREEQKHGNAKSSAEKLADGITRALDKGDISDEHEVLKVFRAMLGAFVTPELIGQARRELDARMVKLAEATAAQETKINALNAKRAGRRQLAM
jgi:hypothetical protein